METVMASISNFALRLPPSLMVDVKAIADHDLMSINQFIVLAVAERVARLQDRGYLAQRRARAKPGSMRELLEKFGSDIQIPGDEIPEGWLDSRPEQPTAAATNRRPARRS
jgi:hypothetical protein